MDNFQNISGMSGQVVGTDEPMQGSMVAPLTPSAGDAQKKSDVIDNDPEKLSKQAAVKRLLTEIAEDKKHWEPDFLRMKDDIAFAVGFQRDGQAALAGDEYVCNLVLRNINQKVASLYARNPTAEWQRQKRLDYTLWDGKMETIQQLAMKVASGGVLMPQEMAIVQDYIHGEQTEQGIEKVGLTLQYLYQRQIDDHDPDFKLQMKSLVRRTCTCGVGFVRLAFVRDIDNLKSDEGMGNTLVDTAKRLSYELEQLNDEGNQDDSVRNEEIKNLIASLQSSVQSHGDDYEMSERLSFDFLTSLSVIPDRLCRNLKGFVGARRVAIEYLLPLEEINAYFDVDVSADKDMVLYKADGTKTEVNTNEDYQNAMGCVYEVFDKSTKSHCFVMEGYSNYLQEPELLEPSVKGFWPIFSLTFNDVEALPDSKATIYPPSDVFLMRHPQKEWNRSREALRKHRNGNAAKYVTNKGWLTENDKDKLENCDENFVVELEGLPSGTSPNQALVPILHDPIDEKCYDTGPLMQDVLLAVGAQDANLGPVNPQGTATGQSIAEQSRNTGLASNVDDVDDFLSQLANAGGQLMLHPAGMSLQTVQTVVGPGAAWPQQNQSEFLNQIFLKVQAASSGKPNKVIDLQNWNLIVPVLMQAGANPQFIVRETIKRLDDNLDPSEAFPLTPQAPPPGMMGPMQGQPQPPQQRSPQGRAKTTQPPMGQQRPGPGQLGPRPIPYGPPPPLSQPTMMSPLQNQ